jgi:hypothetical protein
MNDTLPTIVMVGPTGVGKTSLLAAMYNEIKPIISNLGCTFYCEGPTKVELNARLTELKSLASGKKLNISNVVSIAGSVDKREYDFTIGIPLQKRNIVIEIPIRFIDMPGGWYSGTGNYKEAQETLARSNVSFWCIDSTALMEGDIDQNGLGEYNDIINEPESIFDCYQKASKTLPDEHHIKFILMRSETYLNSGREDELIKRFLTCYEQLFNRLQKNKSDLSGSYCCVQTVGNVDFFMFDVDETGKPKARFKLNLKKSYSPVGCAYPIADALESGLGEQLLHVIEEYKGEILPVWVSRILGLDTKLDDIEAIINVFENIQRNVYGIHNENI